MLRMPWGLPVLLAGVAACAGPVALGPFIPPHLVGLFFLTGLVATIWLACRCGRPIELARQRRALGLCERCGYDPRGNTSGVCPECGAPP